MKRFLVFAALVLFCLPMGFATIVTNSNQSAMYFRLPARNASLDLDATYYNPAGLTQLANGWHLALSNQTIFQEKTVVNEFPLLNNRTYIGDVKAPVFPNLYIVYKKEKLALSFGFGPNGGGGSAEYAKGVPSFEIPISQLPTLLRGMGLTTTAYSTDIYFKGESVYYGFQFNASYAVSDMFSVAGGVRYISAVNTYEGYLKNVQINPKHPLLNPAGNMMSAVEFFTKAGLPAYAALVADKTVDVKQTGSAFTPLLGVNFRPTDRLNIGIRYEFNTSLKLENETKADGTGMFPHGKKSPNDIPGILSFGLNYSAMPEMRLFLSYNLYFDKNADWDGREKFVNSNTYDIGFGFEFDVTDSILVSTGYLRTQIDVSEQYQSDLSQEMSSNTFGFGARIKATNKLHFDLGALYAKNADATKKFPLTGGAQYLETYKRWTWGFALGLGYHF